MENGKELSRVDQGEHYIQYSDGNILIKGMRISFPHLVEPYVDKKTLKESYGFTLLIPKTEEELITFIKREMKKLLTDQLKIKKLPPDRYCLRDGDNTIREEEDGHWILSANSNRPIVVKGGGKRTLDTKEALATIYPGCVVNALIKLWAQPPGDFGMRINAFGNAVQFVGDGERLGTATDVDVYEWDGNEEDDDL
jgi:hypothetical protein